MKIITSKKDEEGALVLFESSPRESILAHVYLHLEVSCGFE